MSYAGQPPARSGSFTYGTAAPGGYGTPTAGYGTSATGYGTPSAYATPSYGAQQPQYAASVGVPSAGSFTQAVPTAGSFTYGTTAQYPGYGQQAADPYAAYGYPAGYGQSVAGGYGAGYPSAYGGAPTLPAPVPSGGSFTATPQFQFYPETSVGYPPPQASTGPSSVMGAMGGMTGYGAGGGGGPTTGPPPMNSQSSTTKPHAGGPPPPTHPVGTGTGSGVRPNLAKGKMSTSSKKKGKKTCCC